MPRPDNNADYRRRVGESSEHNKGPILAVLERVLPKKGLMLEIGAGTGQHAAYFAPRFPGLEWQPTDPDPAMRDSIAAWVEDTGAANLRPPMDLDVTGTTWPVTEADAVFSANMIHIAPWDCCLGLLAGAGKVLTPGAPLALYGPFKRSGEHTAPSNESFDQSLRSRDPAWGVRDLDEVTDAAAAKELDLAETVEMPANNLIAVFRRRE
jgi:SAM-dependent methyltransferase